MKKENFILYIWILLYCVILGILNNIYLVLVLIGYTIALFLYLKKKNFLLDYGFCRVRASIKDFIFFNAPIILFIGLMSYFNFINSNHAYSLIILAQIIICALLEEILFRGYLSVKLKKMKFIIVSSLLFAIAHMINLLNGATIEYTLFQIVWSLNIGICFAISRQTCNSIWPCVIYHVIINITGIDTVQQINSTFNTIIYVTVICACIELEIYRLYDRRLVNETLY